MEIFWRMMLGHFLADFTFQSNAVAAAKRRSVWGMVVHTFMHPAISLVLVWPYVDRVWVSWPSFQVTGIVAVLFVFLTHFLQDEWRVAKISKNPKLDNTLFFSWDQLVHIASIALVVPMTVEPDGGLYGEKWAVLALLLVLATHFTTVLVYFLEKDLWTGMYPGDTEKYLGIAERVVIMVSFLLPGHWWAAVLAAWAGYRIFLKMKRVQDFTWFSFAMSGVVAVLCGIGARVVYYS